MSYSFTQWCKCASSFTGRVSAHAFTISGCLDHHSPLDAFIMQSNLPHVSYILYQDHRASSTRSLHAFRLPGSVTTYDTSCHHFLCNAVCQANEGGASACFIPEKGGTNTGAIARMIVARIRDIRGMLRYSKACHVRMHDKAQARKWASV